MTRLFGDLNKDGVEVFVEDGKVIIMDNQNRFEYPDTPKNRETCIQDAKDTIETWKRDKGEE